MEKSEIVFCRVCGYEYSFDNPPWHDRETPTYDICICCGVQFGYEDDNYLGVISFRNTWLKDGTKWFSPSHKPVDWDLGLQLKNIPQKWE